MTVIYRAHPLKNKSRTLYVGRTKQDLKKYIYHRNRECFISNPTSRRPLFEFLRKNYRTIRNAENCIGWEVLENIPKTETLTNVRRREQYWISMLKPQLNARNETTF